VPKKQKVETATLYMIVEERKPWVSHFLVRFYRQDEPLEMRLRRAVYHYLCTAKGKEHAKGQSGDFNWGDVIDIPKGFLKAEGILDITQPRPVTPCTITVSHDENLAYELRNLPENLELSPEMVKFFWAEIENKQTFNQKDPCTIDEAESSLMQMPHDVLERITGKVNRQAFTEELVRLRKEWGKGMALLSLMPENRAK
jgi:hypothetical protein